MKKSIKIITAVLAICALVSCKKIPQDMISLSPSSVSFPKTGGTEIVNVSISSFEINLYESDANGNTGTIATMTSTSPQTYSLDWISASIDGNTLTITAKENATGQKRYASVHLWDLCAAADPNDLIITQE